jgi:hypothetical protein
MEDHVLCYSISTIDTKDNDVKKTPGCASESQYPQSQMSSGTGIKTAAPEASPGRARHAACGTASACVSEATSRAEVKLDRAASALILRVIDRTRRRLLRPRPWLGCAALPRTGQHRKLTVFIYGLSAVSRPRILQGLEDIA